MSYGFLTPNSFFSFPGVPLFSHLQNIEQQSLKCGIWALGATQDPVKGYVGSKVFL